MTNLKAVGRINGKVTTKEFSFYVEDEIQKFDYVQVNHDTYGAVLCQILELEKDSEYTKAKCVVIGYKDKNGSVKPIRLPFAPNDLVYQAPDSFITKIIKIDSNNGAYIGHLDGKTIPLYLDLEKLLTRHVAILAKSGAGKSYSVGVLLEEIIDKKVPVVILDPHGEYHSLKFPNDEKKEVKLMDEFGIKPTGFLSNVVEFGDVKLNSDVRPLKLKEEFTPEELIDLLPTKLSNSQLSLLYSAIRNVEKLTFSNVIFELENEESNAKWTVINVLNRLANMDYFTMDYTPLNELVHSSRASIINFKGIAPEVQDLLSYKLLKDLFEARKLNKIPPFFLVVEEAHNFAPEKNFGNTRTTSVLRNIASEGRKFGLGLCVITQRPARVEKSVLSQCTTNIILKVTNPNDLKAVSNSVEGLTSEAEKEIQNLPIGTALVTGIVDLPLFVNVRPRKTKHGGKTVNMLSMSKKDEAFFEKSQKFEKKDMLPLIVPNITKKDISLMSTSEIERIDTYLVPAYVFECNDGSSNFNLLIEMIKGRIITSIDEFSSKFLPDIEKLNQKEVSVLENAFYLDKFTQEKFLSKTGFGLDSTKQLASLVKKEFLIFEKGKYMINPDLVLSNLDQVGFFGKIDFKHIDYDMKLKPKKNIDEVKQELSKFVTVNDASECFIIRYSPVKKS